MYFRYLLCRVHNIESQSITLAVGYSLLCSSKLNRFPSLKLTWTITSLFQELRSTNTCHVWMKYLSSGCLHMGLKFTLLYIPSLINLWYSDCVGKSFINFSIANWIVFVERLYVGKLANPAGYVLWYPALMMRPFAVTTIKVKFVGMDKSNMLWMIQHKHVL